MAAAVCHEGYRFPRDKTPEYLIRFLIPVWFSHKSVESDCGYV